MQQLSPHSLNHTSVSIQSFIKGRWESNNVYESKSKSTIGSQEDEGHHNFVSCLDPEGSNQIEGVVNKEARKVSVSSYLAKSVYSDKGSHYLLDQGEAEAEGERS